MSFLVEKEKLINFIVKARKRKAWTQAKLAKEAGLSQGRIAQIENGIGEITFDVLLRLLTTLGNSYRVEVRKSK